VENVGLAVSVRSVVVEEPLPRSHFWKMKGGPLWCKQVHFVCRFFFPQMKIRSVESLMDLEKMGFKGVAGQVESVPREWSE